MADIKNYKSKSNSVSNSQILFSDYTFDKAKIVMEEMVRSGAYELMKRHVITDRINIFIGYSKDNIPPSKGHIKMTATTNVSAVMLPYISACFERIADKTALIRRLGIEFIDVIDEGCEGYDLFTNFEQVEKLKQAERVTLKIHNKFGKNALVRAADLQEGATTLKRNRLIGGHNGE
jgi:DNA polymerase V